MLNTADIQHLREFINVPEGEDPGKTLDRLDGYLAGMAFAADSRERESKARSDRATQAAKKGNKGKGKGQQNKSNGKLKVGDAELAEAEA